MTTEEAPDKCPICKEYLTRIETSNYSMYAYKYNGEEWEQVDHEDGETDVEFVCENCN